LKVGTTAGNDGAADGRAGAMFSGSEGSVSPTDGGYVVRAEGNDGAVIGSGGAEFAGRLETVFGKLRDRPLAQPGCPARVMGGTTGSGGAVSMLRGPGYSRRVTVLSGCGFWPGAGDVDPRLRPRPKV